MTLGILLVILGLASLIVGNRRNENGRTDGLATIIGLVLIVIGMATLS